MSPTLCLNLPETHKAPTSLRGVPCIHCLLATKTSEHPNSSLNTELQNQPQDLGTRLGVVKPMTDQFPWEPGPSTSSCPNVSTWMPSRSKPAAQTVFLYQPGLANVCAVGPEQKSWEHVLHNHAGSILLPPQTAVHLMAAVAAVLPGLRFCTSNPPSPANLNALGLRTLLHGPRITSPSSASHSDTLSKDRKRSA